MDLGVGGRGHTGVSGNGGHRSERERVRMNGAVGC